MQMEKVLTQDQKQIQQKSSKKQNQQLNLSEILTQTYTKHQPLQKIQENKQQQTINQQTKQEQHNKKYSSNLKQQPTQKLNLIIFGSTQLTGRSSFIKKLQTGVYKQNLYQTTGLDASSFKNIQFRIPDQKILLLIWETQSLQSKRDHIIKCTLLVIKKNVNNFAIMIFIDTEELIKVFNTNKFVEKISQLIKPFVQNQELRLCNTFVFVLSKIDTLDDDPRLKKQLFDDFKTTIKALSIIKQNMNDKTKIFTSLSSKRQSQSQLEEIVIKICSVIYFQKQIQKKYQLYNLYQKYLHLDEDYFEIEFGKQLLSNLQKSKEKQKVLSAKNGNQNSKKQVDNLQRKQKTNQKKKCQIM